MAAPIECKSPPAAGFELVVIPLAAGAVGTALGDPRAANGWFGVARWYAAPDIPGPARLKDRRAVGRGAPGEEAAMPLGVPPTSKRWPTAISG